MGTCTTSGVVAMGVFGKAKNCSRFGSHEGSPYICMGCEAALEVQYHSCPSCGGYDIRRTKWLCE